MKTKKASKNNFNMVSFSSCQNLNAPLGTIVVKSINKCVKSKGKTIVDYDKIPQDAVWRKVEAGDKFTKFGGGTKSLKSYLTDIKMNPTDKDGLVVLASGKDVLVIPSVEIAETVKVDNNTKKMIELCLKK